MKWQGVYMATGLLLSFLPVTLLVDRAVGESHGDGDSEGPKGWKYFHEAGCSASYVEVHYDGRYFHGVLDDETRINALKHMVRAWLKWTNKESIETWIAHGTLLGWWWSEQILPWDGDLDVQVYHDTLVTLGREYNQTRHQYIASDGSVIKEYFLDVNPWSWQRVRGDGLNVIDARWIDVDHGIYIDITGISENPEAKGDYICKNYHHYQYDDLYPLTISKFEGEEAKIPHKIDQILIEEYGLKALRKTEYEGHHFDTDENEWIKDKEGDKYIPKPFNWGAVSIMKNEQTSGLFWNLFRLLHWW